MFNALLGRKQPQRAAAADHARNGARLVAALEKLESASRISKPLHQSGVLDAALRLLKQPDGVRVLAGHAERFAAAGVFRGSDWDHPAALQPRLVRGALTGDPRTVVIEVLSELRFLAIVEGRAFDPEVTAAGARNFLSDLLALNMDLLFGRAGEAERQLETSLRDGIREALELVAQAISTDDLFAAMAGEIEAVLKQQPVHVLPVRAQIAQLAVVLASGPELSAPVRERAQALVDALFQPSPLSAGDPGAQAYLAALSGASREMLMQEADACARSMHRHRIVSDYHALLLAHVNVAAPDLVARVLGASELGRQSLGCFRALVTALIDDAVSVAMPQVVLAIWALLERGVLFHAPVAPALWRQRRLDVQGPAEDRIRAVYGPDADARALLLGGIVMVIGMPLGVGQGNNPTCQAARAIALFAQMEPDYLLQLLCWAVRDDEIVMRFEGDYISSRGLADGLMSALDGSLDPVSLALVPHLDRIYAEMVRRASGRGEDQHKWVNPPFHGWWVPRGCRVLVDVATGAIKDFETFQRDFYASYHPFYNGNQPVIHPQPAGIASTNARGEFVGWHAISIQRVTLDPTGEMRVYFHNPNDEGRQQWARDLHTSTQSNGEIPGESSLLFGEFASRVYLFHYDPLEEGDPAAVPQDEIAGVADMARHSWAAGRAWS